MKIKILLVLFVLMSALSNISAKILLQPYLQAVTDTSIIIMVEKDSKDETTVVYSIDSSFNKNASTSFYIKTASKKKLTYVHRIKLNGLKPATKYFYKVKDNNSVSSISHFQTASRDNSQFRFAVLGDFRNNPSIFNIICKETQKHNPRFSIYLGDLCSDGAYESYKQEFFVEEELNLSSSAPFFNAIGNHEGWSENTKAFTQSLSQQTANESYYSFDYGNIHFVILNTEEKITKGSPQYNFIKNDLQKTKKTWKIVAAHIPAYCSGGHGENSNLIALSKDVLIPNHIDFFVAGHSHFYQHNLIDGIRHLVIGAGGAPLYDHGKAKYTVTSAKTYSYTIFDVKDKVLTMTAYDINGKIIDKLDLNK